VAVEFVERPDDLIGRATQGDARGGDGLACLNDQGQAFRCRGMAAVMTGERNGVGSRHTPGGRLVQEQCPVEQQWPDRRRHIGQAPFLNVRRLIKHPVQSWFGERDNAGRVHALYHADKGSR
jgi:hypothetical protein